MRKKDFLEQFSGDIQTLWRREFKQPLSQRGLSRIWQEAKRLLPLHPNADIFDIIVTAADPESTRTATAIEVQKLRDANKRMLAWQKEFKDQLPKSARVVKKNTPGRVTEVFELPDRTVTRVRAPYPARGPRIQLPRLISLHVDYKKEKESKNH